LNSRAIHASLCPAQKIVQGFFILTSEDNALVGILSEQSQNIESILYL